MIRTLLIALVFISFLCEANSPLQLDKRFGFTSNQPQSQSTPEQQTQEILSNIETLSQIAGEYQDKFLTFDTEKAALNKAFASAQKELNLARRQDLNQQASAAHLRLSELKETEIQLLQQQASLLQRHNQLPTLVSSARQALVQHQKSPLLTPDTAAGVLQQTQRHYYEQNLATLETEQATSQTRIELVQLRLKVVRSQLKQQELFIEKLNRAISDDRQAITEATLADSLSPADDHDDDLVLRLKASNEQLGQKLQNLTLQIDDVVKQQEAAETRSQQQSQQISNIQTQIAWVKTNSAFGERFLQMLHNLPKPPNPQASERQIAETRLARYQIEQYLALNQEQLNQQDQFSPVQYDLLTAESKLLKQLMLSFDQLLSELAKLKVSQENLLDQYHTLKNTLSEHLFWVPNAAPIGKLWITDLHRSLIWLFQQAPWQQLSQALDEQGEYWSWWLILLVLCLAIQDIIKPHFYRALNRLTAPVGKVTQDNFMYTLETLLVTVAYALILPSPVILAGAFFMLSQYNLVQAVGCSLLVMGCAYLVYRIMFLLSMDNGLLIGHFARPKEIIDFSKMRLKSLMLLTIPLVAIVSFAEVLGLSLLRNSIGRGAFILLCFQLFWFYRDMVKFANKYKSEQQGPSKNRRLLQRLLWMVVLLTPVVSAVLAWRGFYFTAFQLLLQLQLSLLLVLGFVLLYQLIKRWMLIERRRIAFDRAKARRAEKLSQRERGETLLGDNLDVYEEPSVDLETISSQSLGLVRSLLILAFLASLIGLWTQTHSAMYSLLDGINLWNSTTLIDGNEQMVPVTLKSVLFGILFIVFSLIIATNLPGLLELVLLQRLDLSPGTGFAISTVSRYLVVMLGTLVGFSTLGMEWSKLQWLIAALSVGLGFGLQEIFANFISGLIILFEKPVRIGDTVTIRDLSGTVSKIQIRATTIIDWDRKEIIVPNKAFITEQLINWSLSDPITRVIIKVAVARDSDPAKVEASLYQAIEECEHALPNPEPEVWFAGFGQHTQDYEVRAYAKDMGSRWPLRHDLHKRIRTKLKENNLELAYPQMEITIKQGGAPSRDPQIQLR
ncbi:mechanosensitive ion channel domain-containing protein [Shewanella litorisediminis]|uniref:Mechanosensitive ion channel n=1 Tax=Shewanella litorisediminis TaxID=1173586 RepID=A0ABX7G1P3_9GAMM|nr:mechanosensitive ion channel domain-containing protein [Shewanella litorisediminis]MCL2918427.1 mechanosensitive ion channel [Shewanella litorisediminis]QRH01262.1 mechanosensitive ion channel [Shewanella litorisediminis]